MLTTGEQGMGAESYLLWLSSLWVVASTAAAEKPAVV